ncbi:MAG: DUF4198 domain-containing protein [Scandinavium sp.]|uniref:DUF4198 domain-containing protein n=1 Tax=Scandinavium sp. TaxID=2830653 RepID=UPI003F408920
MKALKQAVVALALLACGIRAAQAHEFWLIPHDAQSHTGAQVLFELRIGSGLPGKRSVRIPGLVADFTATDANGTYAVSGHDNSLVLGHLRSRTAGATLAALQTHQAQITLSATEFEAYLQEEGLEKILLQRREAGDSAQPASELYSRCAKSIVLVDGKSEGFDKTLGLPLELIPLTEPLHYQSGEAYRLRLIRDGKPLAGTQVKALLKGYFLKARTDEKGEVTFTLPGPGVWLFSAEDMVPSQNPDAEWESVWASVTLDVGEKEAL